MNPYPVCRDQCSDFRPVLPQSIRSIVDEASLDRRDSYDFGRQARRTAGEIELLEYRIRPADLFDRYIEAARTDGDWLAFHATCVLERECRYADTLEAAFRGVERRYGIDLPARLVDHLGIEAMAPSDFRDSGTFAAACHEDAACRTVMAGLNYPVIIGAVSGEPVVGKVERYQLRDR
jgi:hypothetical protein